MAWHAIYVAATGRLVSVGEIVVSPLPGALTDLVLAGEPNLSNQVWDTTTKTFITRPGKVLIDRLDDLQSNPNYNDLQAALATLSAPNRTVVRNAFGRLLNRVRFRTPGEPVEIG